MSTRSQEIGPQSQEEPGDEVVVAAIMRRKAGNKLNFQHRLQFGGPGRRGRESLATAAKTRNEPCDGMSEMCIGTSKGVCSAVVW